MSPGEARASAPAGPPGPLEAPPVPEGFERLEEPVRLSHSVVWSLLRDFYDSRGDAAWGDGVVPNFISSNAFVARAYARIVHAFFRDAGEDGPAGDGGDGLFYVVEMAAGNGRLGHGFLRAWEELFGLEDGPQICYVLTDGAESNIASWQRQPQLAAWAAAGRLDFAAWDLDRRDAELELRVRGTTLDGANVDRPLAAIANYAFDSLRQDAFLALDGALHECRLTLDAPADFAADTAPYLNALQIGHAYEPVELPYYDDTAIDGLLAEYLRQLGDGHFLLPVGAFRAVEALTGLARRGALLLCADMGAVHLEELRGAPPPRPTRHGSIGLPVNFDALARRVEALGGHTAKPATRSPHLAVTASFLGIGEGPATRRALTECLDGLGPDAYFAVNARLDLHLEEMPLSDVLACLKLAAWDSHPARRCLPRLYELARRGLSAAERTALGDAVDRIWSRQFAAGEASDLDFDLGTLLTVAAIYDQAVTFLERSLERTEHPATLFNLALCHYGQGHLDAARRCAERALELDAENPSLQDLVREIERTGEAAKASARPSPPAGPMVRPRTLTWDEANRRHLLAAVDVVRAILEDLANRQVDAEAALPDRRGAAAAVLEGAAAAMPAPAALDHLCALFSLTPLERGVLLLGVGMELDPAFAALCAAAGGDDRPYPTFRLALELFPGLDRSVLSPESSLRRWRMIELGAGQALATRPFALAERVLHQLLGHQHLDERLGGIVEPVPVPDVLAPSHRELAERLAQVWAQVRDPAAFQVVQLCGGELSERRAVAAAACASLGRQLGAMAATSLPAASHELEALRRVWELEGALSNSSLLLEQDGLMDGDSAGHEAVARLTEQVLGGVIVSSPERRASQAGRRGARLTLELEPPPFDEQRQLWRQALEGRLSDEHDAVIDRLSTQFRLGATAIRAAGLTALTRCRNGGDGLAAALWEACRQQARPRLDELAQPIAAGASWEHLVLPPYQLEMLRQVAVHVRQRRRVYEEWGFGESGEDGLGVTALFAGSSGTGKTMAAKILAGELRLDLYRIDLSAVVSKYIGETEKNLRQIFDAAEAGGAILLFDEADALFGKRSDVKDSHDRHANIEVSYLLQRMEAYRGLAILTTNIKSALDVAFLRRLRFIVDFPFPNQEQRAEIWRRAFPPRAPTEGLDFLRLAQLNATGGIIRNIALHAAFLAADADEPLRMAHLLRAARGEWAKLGRSLTPSDIEGWV